MNFTNDDELYQVIGSNIKFYREKTGLTQIQLSEKLQISISYLSKIEAHGCNKSVSISLLNHVANVLNIDIIEFFKRRNTYGQKS